MKNHSKIYNLKKVKLGNIFSEVYTTRFLPIVDMVYFLKEIIKLDVCGLKYFILYLF